MAWGDLQSFGEMILKGAIASAQRHSDRAAQMLLDALGSEDQSQARDAAYEAGVALGMCFHVRRFIIEEAPSTNGLDSWGLKATQLSERLSPTLRERFEEGLRFGGGSCRRE